MPSRGTGELDDGTRTSGLPCEPHALASAPDITRFGGERKDRDDRRWRHWTRLRSSPVTGSWQPCGGRLIPPGNSVAHA